MPNSKLCALSDAIARFVPHGSAVAMGTALESLIPFAAGHELIRQRKRDLTLIGPISDILFDQLIGAGCVRRVRSAWVGNVVTGSGYNFRRAVESGQIEIEDHSNLTLAMALRAGAAGVPFMPTRTALGSDLYQTNSSLKQMTCPFTGETLTAVAAINPDVTIIHVQRADEFGNAHMWGNFGVTREACLASARVIVTAEEIVPTEAIQRDPNRVLTPGFLVAAVVHAPWGAHPSSAAGFYDRDHQASIEYQKASRTPRDFAEWQAEWIDGITSREQFIAKVGAKRLNTLQITHHSYTEPVDYGY